MTKTNLELIPGTTGRWRVTVLDADGVVVNVSPSNLVEAWFTVKTLPGDASPLVQVSLTGAQIQILNGGAGGQIEITIPADSSESWTPSSVLYWDLRLKFQNGTVETPDALTGRLVVVQNITESTKN